MENYFKTKDSNQNLTFQVSMSELSRKVYKDKNTWRLLVQNSTIYDIIKKIDNSWKWLNEKYEVYVKK